MAEDPERERIEVLNVAEPPRAGLAPSVSRGGLRVPFLSMKLPEPPRTPSKSVVPFFSVPPSMDTNHRLAARLAWNRPVGVNGFRGKLRVAGVTDRLPIRFSTPTATGVASLAVTRFHDVANRIRRDRTSRQSRPIDDELRAIGDDGKRPECL